MNAEFLKQFMTEGIAVSCVTKEECELFVKFINDNTTEKWPGRIFGYYEEETCYIWSKGGLMYSPKDYYLEDGYDIIKFSNTANPDSETVPEPIGLKVFAIREKLTGKLFFGRNGIQSLWENLGPMKISFFQSAGVKMADQDNWEVITYKCIEE